MLLSDEARDRILRDNALDYALYEHAESLLERRMAEYGLRPSGKWATHVCNALGPD